MKLLLLAVCLCPISMWAQQASLSPIPDCSSGYCSGLGVPVFRCNPGWHFAQMDNPGINWTCTGIPPSWVKDSMVQTPALSVSKTMTVTPQTIRGIVGAYAGLSTSNSSIFLDIFPVGYNPWATGIRFEDGATDTFGSAIELGLTADGQTSQHIRFYGSRTATFDSTFDLYVRSSSLIWAGIGDGIALGEPNVSGDYEQSYAARFGYDATNKNALVHFGGSVTSTNGGVGFSSGATLGLVYWGLFDQNGNFGVGPQHDESISNVALNNPFSVAGAGQAVPGAVKAPMYSVPTANMPAGCPQLPCMLAQNVKLAQTAAVGGTTVYTTPASGWYQICGEVFITTVGTAGTISSGWSSTISPSGGSEGHTLVGAITATAVGGASSCTGDIFAGSGSVLSYSSTFTGVTGTPAYTMEASVKLEHL